MEFEGIVRETQAEARTKGFSCWGQFVGMMFCHIGQAHSLREISQGLAAGLGKLRHLGIPEAPRRSTLAYANAHRPWTLYQHVFHRLLERCQGAAERHTKRKFRFKHKLYSFDATLVELCASLFDWAHFQRTKGAVKLHLLLDHQGYLPTFAHVTIGDTHEVTILRDLDLSPGSIVAIDRGCVDYALFARWTRQGIFFVTRLKSNAVYRVTRRREVPERGAILKDEDIVFTGPRSIQDCPCTLRRIEVWNEEHQAVIVLLTNHPTFGATTIARIYKDRWQIEIFFKTLKQHLHIKTFVGTSANALHIQIWTALIALLILKYLHLTSQWAGSLSNLVALIRLNLFTYRDLWAWLKDPWDTPPYSPPPQQMTLWA
jgi:hypothetical protein